VSSRTIAGSPARALTADAGRRFDVLVVAAITWLLGGLYADGWAHGNGLPDSFWTVWHAIFYSGFAACAAVLLGTVAIGAGLVGDLLLWRLRPSAARPLALRTIAAAVPVAYFVLYFAVVDVRYGFGWTFTFISGSVILCGVVGLLLSVVAVPPGAAAD
jgi:hypothetical protein